jgi:hypothetical protein
MAETEAAAEGGKNFLMQKVGPLPMFVWLGFGLVVWYYIQNKNKASSTATTTSAIDPSTGVPYSQEIGAYGQQVSDLQSQVDGTPGSQSTTAGQYQDNSSWSVAAINYLVAQGVDPTQANQAVEQFLSGQTLTTQQQADVNLAIQGIGAPPSPPGPSSTNPGQVITPPSTTTPSTPKPTTTPAVTQYPPPSGLKVTGTSANSVSLAWNDTPATVGGQRVYPPSYTVRIWQLNGKVASETTVDAPNDKGGLVQTTVTGLHTKWQYKAQVWPNGGQKAPSGANTTFTCK